jgi:hypothetical protein
MPRLTFSFGPDGLLVPALVSPSSADQQAQGSPLPAHVRARGMLDSGSTLTAVVTFYKISFSIYQPGSGSLLTRTDWQVTGLAEDLPDVDVLFGLDLLHEIVLTVDGPGGTFTLDF